VYVWKRSAKPLRSTCAGFGPARGRRMLTVDWTVLTRRLADGKACMRAPQPLGGPWA